MDFLVSDDPLPDEVVEETIDVERRAGWLQERARRAQRARAEDHRANAGCSEDGATLEALGETLGISKERVRQIESRALEKLKSALVKDNPASWQTV